ncbi:serine protein kinase RIO [Candidatus Woesearchaeota archaeon]|nr:serine protein kinase RIO [Candidatus Woesearchaeota archaeon]
MPKISREKFKTLHNVFDEFTERNIFKLMGQRHFEGFYSAIGMGKEANVFVARKHDGTFVVVKIYRLHTCDFNTMYNHIKFDARYLHLKKQRRKVIFAWTQREFRNLLKAREAGVAVPTPYTFLYNILVMEMIGGQDPAGKLIHQQPKDPDAFLATVVTNMQKVYRAGLIHGDLSPFNILNDKERAVFIDFSQATPLESANAEELLAADIKNVCVYFRKLRVDITEDVLRKKILENNGNGKGQQTKHRRKQ